MTSSIDSNVFVALWGKDANSLHARKALNSALSRGKVVASGVVSAELLGGAGRSIEILDELFDWTGSAVD